GRRSGRRDGDLRARPAEDHAPARAEAAPARARRHFGSEARLSAPEPEQDGGVLIEEPGAPIVEPELPATLPVLPLKDTVVFPESMTPLAIGQERSIKLIDDVVGGDRLLALVTVRNEEADTPEWNDLYATGTAAVVHKMIRV